jgi:hypothetical protein
MPKHSITWIDRPAFPDGIDIPPQFPERASCKVLLPYPAKRIGLYVVNCHRCGVSVACTTAGRPDDPRSMTINCKGSAH